MQAFSAVWCGTRFGSVPARSDNMTANLSSLDRAPTDSPHAPRQRERRQAFGDLLAALTRGIDRRGDVPSMRGAFEEMLRRVVPVRSIQLRELTERWTPRPDAPASVESIALEVPTPESAIQAVLEATFDPE